MKILRLEFVRAWKAWRKARAIRAAMAKLGYGRAGPVKAWYDECTVMMRRARRAVMMELRKPEPVTRPTMYEWVDMGIREGKAFMRIHTDGQRELLRNRDVFEEPKSPAMLDRMRRYNAMLEKQMGFPPAELRNLMDYCKQGKGDERKRQEQGKAG